MNNELGEQVYRKLHYFYINEILIHFDLVRGGWKNGKVISLNEKELTFTLKENVEGEMPFLCEEVELNSIAKFREKKEEDIEKENLMNNGQSN